MVAFWQFCDVNINTPTVTSFTSSTGHPPVRVQGKGRSDSPLCSISTMQVDGISLNRIDNSQGKIVRE